MNVRRVILVRHAPSTWSEKGILQGHQDPPLSDRGRAMLPDLLKLVRSSTGDGHVRVASSDRQRALDTARYLSSGLKSDEILPVESLREVGFGHWEGRSESDLDNEPELKAAYQRLDPRVVWPGAVESLGDTFTRAADFVDHWSFGTTGMTFVVVSHGIVLQGILSRVFFGDYEHADRFDLPSGGVSVVDLDQDFRLHVVHLLGCDPAATG